MSHRRGDKLIGPKSIPTGAGQSNAAPPENGAVHLGRPGAVRRLADYDRSRHDPGRGLLVRGLWYAVSVCLFESGFLPLSRPKSALLRLFGARVGRGVVIKPNVRIKYPWRLVVGDDCWIGQECWIDNVAEVKLADNVCLSQGSYLCTGSHDHGSPLFDLITRPIHVEEGAWVGAAAVLLPGVVVGRGSAVGAGAVVTRDVEAGRVVAGNPAAPVPGSRGRHGSRGLQRRRRRPTIRSQFEGTRPEIGEPRR